MIYPAALDLTVVQNSTWSQTFRASANRQEITDLSISSGVPTFTCPCHGLSLGDKVILTDATRAPCDLELDRVYYVISTNLTHSTFQISETLGGGTVHVTSPGTGTLYVSQPVDLTGYTVDADIVAPNQDAQIATFTTALLDAANGQFSLSLSPTTTRDLRARSYSWDVSLTSPGGERYYWAEGMLTVERTYSRN